MSEIKVKVLDGIEQKSTQEIERELLEKHEQKQAVEEQPVEQVEEVKASEEGNEIGGLINEVEKLANEPNQIDEKDVLSYIKSRYEKEINSIDDLFSQREQNEELPEDVSAFLKYKKDTGRGIEDFMKLQANYDDANPDQLLREYYAATENDLDKEDIDYLISEKFSYDEEVDDESDVKQKQIAKKRELAKAKKYFNELKETYKAPLESSGNFVSEEEKNSYEAYKKYIQESESAQIENTRRSEYFQKRTDEVFSNDFKGFDFNVGDTSFSYLPGDAKEIKNIQSDFSNFISKYLDDDGMITDAKGYHKALSVAMNPDKFAKFFYEQGMANAIDKSVKSAKNIDMGVRTAPQQMNQSGFSVRAINSDSGRGLKIKSTNK